MNIEELLTSMSVDISSQEWKFALKNMYVNFSVDVKKLECIGGYECTFSRESVSGRKIIGDTDGYIICTNLGILVVCPKKDDFPVTAFISKKDIRVVEADTKFFKSFIKVKTNDDSYIFKIDKKQLKDLEKLVNKTKMM